MISREQCDCRTVFVKSENAALRYANGLRLCAESIPGPQPWALDEFK